MNKNQLSTILLEQQDRLKLVQAQSWVPRKLVEEIATWIPLSHAIIISGVRRCGKSSLVAQLLKLHYPEGVYYVNFEDERFIDFKASEFNDILEVYLEVLGPKKIFFLDEVQNVPQWELFVRRLQDEGYKFFITGSNAALLSQELGTRLTGRHLLAELLPFSFAEYLIFRGLEWNALSLHQTKTKALLKKNFTDFLRQGGMPEYLQYEKAEMLNQLYNDILFRDIIVRYGIKEVHAMRSLSLFLLSHAASLISFNSLKKWIPIKSVTTISNYVHYLENSYLIFTVYPYSRSLKEQQVLPKKLYIIDQGLGRTVAFHFSENQGHYLENIVYLELRRRHSEIYYYRTEQKKEIDFLIVDQGRITQLIQVCQGWEQVKTRERELAALFQALEETALKQALILTEDTEEEIRQEGNLITVMPIYRWLLSGPADKAQGDGLRLQ